VRVFRDLIGGEWEVVVGRESWGTVVAIFLPREGSSPSRQALMDSSSVHGGTRHLLAMTEEELRGLFMRSGEKPTGYD